MTFGQQILFFFSAVGAFNGLLLGIYLLFVKKLKYIPDFFLGLLLLMLSLRVGISVCIYFYPDLPRLVPYLGLAGLFFTGPALYYYVKSSFQQHFDLRNCRKLFGILTLILGAVGLLYLFFPITWDRYIGTFIYTVWSVFMFLTAYQYYIFSKQRITSSNKFVFLVYVSNVIIFLTYQLISTGWVQIYCAGGSLVFSFVLYANFLILFNRKHQEVQVKEVNNRYSNRKISEEQADNFVFRLEKLMDAEELYKNPNLKLNDLASRMNMSAHQLSQLLNDNLGKSFSTYINEYRINEACEKIENGSYLKIEEIGYEVGFNSKSTFFSTFKKIKNTTPLLYKQIQTHSESRVHSLNL